MRLTDYAMACHAGTAHMKPMLRFVCALTGAYAGSAKFHGKPVTDCRAQTKAAVAKVQAIGSGKRVRMSPELVAACEAVGVTPTLAMCKAWLDYHAAQ